MRTINIITLLLIIVGGVNWLLVGAFNFDLVAAIFGGQTAILARSSTSWSASLRSGSSFPSRGRSPRAKFRPSAATRAEAKVGRRRRPTNHSSSSDVEVLANSAFS